MKYFQFTLTSASIAFFLHCAESSDLSEYDVFLFANTGREDEKQLEYFRDILVPYANQEHIKLLEIYPRPPKSFCFPLNTQAYGPAARLQISTSWIEAETPTGLTLKQEDYYSRLTQATGSFLRSKGTASPGYIQSLEKHMLAAIRQPRPLATLGMDMVRGDEEYHHQYPEWMLIDYPLLRRKWSAQDCQKIIERSSLPMLPEPAPIEVKPRHVKLLAKKQFKQAAALKYARKEGRL